MSTETGPGFPEIPGYTLESILGRGSMATVYRARQEGMNRLVAVKVLEETVCDNEKVLGRLMREARIAARFNHSHIVRALDAGTLEHTCYFVMELVEGQNIRDVLEADGPMPESQIVELAIQMGEALLELHRDHVVHRDIKPANILLDEDGQALLADLGLAKLEFDSSMTSQNHAVGTPAYMSPEQAKNPEQVDTRTDLFSLGATLFHMATGDSPFSGDSVGAVITKILYEDPPHLSESHPHLSSGFADIVERLLCKDRENRYQTPAELLRDLRAVKRGLAPRPRLKKPKRAALKGRGVLVGSVLLMAVIAYLGLSTNDDEQTTNPPSVAGGKPRAKDRETAKVLKESDVDEVMTRVFLGPRSRLQVGDLDGAERLLATECEDQLSRELNSTLTDLPRWVRIQFENENLKIKNAIEGQRRKREEALLSVALAHFRSLVEGRQENQPYLSRGDLQDFLLAEPMADEGHPMDPEVVSKARSTVIDEVLAFWRHDFDRQMETAKTNLSLNEFSKVEAALDALKKRLPIHLGSGYVTRIKSLEARLARQHREMHRLLTSFLQSADMLAPLGSPEIRQREFTALISRFVQLNELIGRAELEGDGLHQQFMLVGSVLKEARSWTEKTLDELLEKPIDEDRVLQLRSGKTWKRFQVDSIVDGLITIHLGKQDRMIEIPAAQLSVRTLIDLAEPEPGLNQLRTIAWFHYCDVELAQAERVLSSLPADDPFRQFLASRLKGAWREVAQVDSPEGKEAFRIWRESLTAYRNSDWQGVLKTARALTSSRDLKKSAWYVRNRLSIRRILEECRSRASLAGVLESVHGEVEIVSVEKSLVHIAWNFDDEEQAEDFLLPPHMRWAKGCLKSTRTLENKGMSPLALEALKLFLPMNLDGSSWELEITYHTSSRWRESPRYFLLSVFGHHIGYLSRLGRRHLLHLPLHGLEKKMMEFEEYGRSTMWSGRLSGFAAAFGPGSKARGLLLEPGKTYVLRLSCDVDSGMVTLTINGRTVLARKGVFETKVGESLAIRIPMPHVIDSIHVTTALTVDKG